MAAQQAAAAAAGTVPIATVALNPQKPSGNDVINNIGSIIYNNFLFCLAFIHVILRAAPTCAALIFIFGVIHETVH
jgi:NADH:ubiquinone oxidoreductase subunit 6 (subunit J)